MYYNDMLTRGGMEVEDYQSCLFFSCRREMLFGAPILGKFSHKFRILIGAGCSIQANISSCFTEHQLSFVTT